ncbi:hypothetical protein GCM10022378_19770 [Salinicoccus jeotgali]|uniref:Uncharacterized protein n=1 Tax=Salinicoccus jeotgali TaxID=381634 RepID=A0ABP7F5M3_9STAP
MSIDKKFRDFLKYVLPKDIQKKLIKQVIFDAVECNKEDVLIDLKLQNFYKNNSKSKLKVVLSDDQIIYELPFRFKKNGLQIELDHNILKMIKDYCLIEIIFEGKSLNIQSYDEEYSQMQKNAFFSNKRFFNITAHGNLMISNILPEYNSEQPVDINDIHTRYNYLSFVVGENNNNSSIYNLAFLYNFVCQNKLDSSFSPM